MLIVATVILCVIIAGLPIIIAALAVVGDIYLTYSIIKYLIHRKD